MILRNHTRVRSSFHCFVSTESSAQERHEYNVRATKRMATAMEQQHIGIDCDELEPRQIHSLYLSHSVSLSRSILMAHR